MDIFLDTISLALLFSELRFFSDLEIRCKCVNLCHFIFVSAIMAHNKETHDKNVNDLCRVCGCFTLTFKEKQRRLKPLRVDTVMKKLNFVCGYSLKEDESFSLFVCRKCYNHINNGFKRYSIAAKESLNKLLRESESIWAAFDEHALEDDCTVCNRWPSPNSNRHQHTHISCYLAYFKRKILPKQHILQKHCVPYIRRHGYALWRAGEQGTESSHQTIARIKRRAAAIVNNVEKLKFIMTTQLLNVSPMLRFRKEKKKRKRKNVPEN